ncbi:cupin domain-containing protein [Bordetella muralis]|jgi:mannose-6-phosphate isomerase-like protein (cupin superfamily)|uniref:cupin domain-containing protein n=1 Tax=Bordetella muralis TaxID=1649130 RepID=UPI0039F0F486
MAWDIGDLLIRRVITGVSRSDSVVPITSALPTFHVTELWKTDSTPASLSQEDDLCAGPLELEPPPCGTLLRYLEFPPDSVWQGKVVGSEVFGAMGDSGRAAIDTDAQRHELMHQTHTLDYIIVLEGEIVAILDDSETVLQAGDVLIQRGTRHAWSVRGNEKCRMVAVLIDARKPEL